MLGTVAEMVTKMSDSYATQTPWRLTTPPVDALPGAADWGEPTRWEPRGPGSASKSAGASASSSLSPRSRSPAAVPAEPLAGDIGYRLDPQDHELLVSCEPADALQQQFDIHHSEFIAVHDLGALLSRRLLGGVAAAGHRPLQRLHIRRRGSGDMLAIVHFLELPTSDDRTLRFYTTESDAPPPVRLAISRVLLANAALAVVMVSEAALRKPDAAFAPLHAELSRAPWPNRQMLLLPMEPQATLARELARVGQDLSVRHGLQVLTTPMVHRPSEAWLFLQSSFTRLKNEGTMAPPRRQTDLFGEATSSGGASGSSSNAFAAGPAGGARGAHPAHLEDTVPAGIAPSGRVSAPSARTSPSPTSPPGSGSGSAAADPRWAPAVGSLTGITAGMGLGQPLAPPEIVTTRSAGTSADRFTGYLQRIAQIAGLSSACVFEVATGRELAHVGQRPDPQLLARHGSALFSAMIDASRGLGLGTALPDATLSLAQHHLLVRAVPGYIDHGLHLVLDRSASNLMLTRVQLQRLDAEFTSKPAATTPE